MRTIIYLDIETIPAQNPAVKEEIAATMTHPKTMSVPATIAKWEINKKPEAIEEAWEKTGLDGAFGEVWCIAWAINDGPIMSLTRQDSNVDSEEGLLSSFFATIKETAPLPDNWAGHNVRNFDLRFLWQRSVVLGIAPGVNLMANLSPYDKAIIDTMTWWAGYRNMVSLDKVCRALGMPGKGDMDGSQVWDYVKAGRWQEVRDYCKSDVEKVRNICRRLNYQAELPCE